MGEVAKQLGIHPSWLSRAISRGRLVMSRDRLFGCYLFLILWSLNLAAEARDRFAETLCVGCAVLLFWHVFFNIGMVAGILPVVGVTLPLVSYGGSSLLAVMIVLGLLMNVSVRRYN